MLPQTLLPFALSFSLTQAAETVLGLYIFSRHGDRTSKAYPPTSLTDLGYSEIFSSGTWFRENYINGSSPINGIEPNNVKLSQIVASAPLDNVLWSSTQGFLQGLYPPVGATLGSQTLGNGTIVAAPLDGYQIIPIQIFTIGTGSEDSAWLQGASNCANAEVSSNNYFTSSEYMALQNSTQAFYSSILPTINTTFNASQATFENAYLSKILFPTSPFFPLFQPNLTPLRPSLRLPQRRRNPQRHHPLLQPPHPRNPPPNPHPSRQPRVQPRLQLIRPHPRHRRRHPRRPDRNSPQRNHHLQRHDRFPKPPARRIRPIPILLRPREPDILRRRLDRHPRLRVHDDLRNIHRSCADAVPNRRRHPSPLLMAQRHNRHHVTTDRVPAFRTAESDTELERFRKRHECIRHRFAGRLVPSVR